ncbi:MAG: beta-lactamase family protein [Sphingomonadales bacterium]|nr:beta-lactamase family protein [Sphingomonadales bacterium]
MAVVAAVTSCSATAQARTQAERAQDLLDRLEQPGAPGCAVGVYRDGIPVFEGAYGVADIASGARLTPQSAFGVASVSKQFMAAAVGLAAEKGVLGLADDVRKYVPELPDYGTPITIADLIYHRSGLRDDWTLIRLSGKNLQTRGDIIKLLGRQKSLVFKPGTRFLYSNSGYVLLAEILERATGRSYPDFARDSIFGPLGMTHSYVRDRPIPNTALATPYIRGSSGWEVRDNPHTAARIGTNGVVTTVRDYAAWADNLIVVSSRLQGGAPFTTLLRTQGRLVDGEPIPYAFGLRTVPYKGLETISHGGSGFGFKAHSMIFPQRGVSIAGFCNNGGYAQALVMGLADIFLDLPGDVKGAADSASSAIALARYEGIYREPALGIAMVVKADGDALLVRGDSVPLRFYPVSENRFRADGNIEIAFEQAGRGGPMELRQISERNYGTGRFSRINPVAPKARELASYAGVYRSAELDSRYRLAVDNGTLTIEPLEPDGDLAFRRPMIPMRKDEFVGLPDIAIRFSRDARGRVAGFSLNAQYGWVTDIGFVRERP